MVQMNLEGKDTRTMIKYTKATYQCLSKIGQLSNREKERKGKNEIQTHQM